MNRSSNIEIGQKFGDLTVTGEPFRRWRGRNRVWFWPVACKCGGSDAKTKENLTVGRCGDCGRQLARQAHRATVTTLYSETGPLFDKRTTK